LESSELGHSNQTSVVIVVNPPVYTCFVQHRYYTYPHLNVHLRYAKNKYILVIVQKEAKLKSVYMFIAEGIKRTVIKVWRMFKLSQSGSGWHNNFPTVSRLLGCCHHAACIQALSVPDVENFCEQENLFPVHNPKVTLSPTHSSPSVPYIPPFLVRRYQKFP